MTILKRYPRLNVFTPAPQKEPVQPSSEPAKFPVSIRNNEELEPYGELQKVNRGMRKR